jgi:hypothetical protein
MRLLTSILTASLFAVSLAAHADNIVTFDASGLFHADSATLSGTFTVDTTTGIVDAVDLFVSGPDFFTFNGIYAQSCTLGPNSNTCFVTFDTNGTNFATYPILNLVLGINTLVGYDGGLGTGQAPLNHSSSDLQFMSGTIAGVDFEKLQMGSLTPEVPSSPNPSPTPEPSSIILLGTGTLGIIGAGRRRLAEKQDATCDRHVSRSV